MSIREAHAKDVADILRLIKDLAIYEKAPNEVVATEELLNAALFGPQPHVFAHVVEVDNRVIGMAIWFLNFSTWQGVHGIYLEDLYIEPEYRGRGYGLALLKHLAKICVERGYGRFQWWVLDWNTPSIEFYKSQGAIAMDEWTVFRVSGEDLTKLGS
jgi:GNAT superfamily N-acetyltransferase